MGMSCGELRNRESNNRENDWERLVLLTWPCGGPVSSSLRSPAGDSPNWLPGCRTSDQAGHSGLWWKSAQSLSHTQSYIIFSVPYYFYPSFTHSHISLAHIPPLQGDPLSRLLSLVPLLTCSVQLCWCIVLYYDTLYIWLQSAVLGGYILRMGAAHNSCTVHQGGGALELTMREHV